jgi:hypothetical protein
MRFAFAIVPYFLILSVGVVVFPSAICERYRLSHPRRWRMIFATYLALIFTPSILSDFFLWSIPGPATIGLLLIGPSVIFGDHRIAALVLVVKSYLLPILAGFVVFYVALSLYEWCRLRRSRNSN